jgi:hypothetical protein
MALGMNTGNLFEKEFSSLYLAIVFIFYCSVTDYSSLPLILGGYVLKPQTVLNPIYAVFLINRSHI